MPPPYIHPINSHFEVTFKEPHMLQLGITSYSIDQTSDADRRTGYEYAIYTAQGLMRLHQFVPSSRVLDLAHGETLIITEMPWPPDYRRTQGVIDLPLLNTPLPFRPL